VTRRFLLVLALLVVFATMGATIYKWVDEKGVTHYSAVPPPDQKVKKVETVPAPAGADGGETAREDWQQKEREFQSRRQKAQEEARDARTLDERSKRCALARQQLGVLEQGSKRGAEVYGRDEHGRRVYLDEAERAAEIARLRQSVASLCAGVQEDADSAARRVREAAAAIGGRERCFRAKEAYEELQRPESHAARSDLEKARAAIERYCGAKD
jgi:hypothetical protein